MSNNLGPSFTDAPWNWTPVAPGWRVSDPGNAVHSYALVGWTMSGRPVYPLNGELAVWTAPFTVFFLT